MYTLGPAASCPPPLSHPPLQPSSHPTYSHTGPPSHLEFGACCPLVWRLRQPAYHLFAPKAPDPSSVLPQYPVCPTVTICHFELPSPPQRSVDSIRPRPTLSWPLLRPHAQDRAWHRASAQPLSPSLRVSDEGATAVHNG